MLSNFYRNCIKFYSQLVVARNNIMNQNKFYLRYIENEDKVDINFLFKIKEDIWRQFNFSRKPSETLDVMLNRIGVNIQKAVNKSNKKKKAQPESTAGQIAFTDKFNSEIPSSTTCFDLFKLEGPVKLKIFDETLDAVFNPPWVLGVNLPKCILAGFPVYPEHLETQFAERDYSKFNWYVGVPTNEKGNAINDTCIKWELVGSSYMYKPSVTDIGKKLKLECLPGNRSAIGPSVEVISQNVVEAGPGQCPFELRQMFTTHKLAGRSFRCVTYNILADLYCDSDYTRTVLHPYCPPYALQMDYRKQLIVKELLGYNADVMCLQEVDSKIFFYCLSPLLDSAGLDGVFYKKGKEVAEGLACFYRRDRFRLLSEQKICLAEAIQTEKCLESIWNVIKDNKPLLDRLLDRSTVASATVLQSLDNPEEVLLVGNTHLYFHPDSDHIRLIQGGIFNYWIRSIMKDTIKSTGKNVSVIMCGDFNSVPSCGIYQLYTTGVAPSDLPDWSSNAAEAVHNLTLSQDVPLASACGTPDYTNFTAEFADCLDYIFYDTSKLEVEQVIPLPTVEELRAHTALPSIVFPSDHISLVADLKWK